MKSFLKVHRLSIICKLLDPVTLQSVITETSFASIGLSTDAPAAAVTSLSLHRLYCAQRLLWLGSLCCTAASAVAKKAYAGVAVPVASAAVIDAVFLVGFASYLFGPPQQSAS